MKLAFVEEIMGAIDKLAVDVKEMKKSTLPQGKRFIVRGALDFQGTVYRVIDTYTSINVELNVEDYMEAMTKAEELENKFNPGLEEIQQGRIVPLNSLKSERYVLKKPIYITIDSDKDGSIANFEDVEIYATGDTDGEAIDALCENIIELYKHMVSSKRNLGPLPKKHLICLEEFIEDRKLCDLSGVGKDWVKRRVTDPTYAGPETPLEGYEKCNLHGDSPLKAKSEGVKSLCDSIKCDFCKHTFECEPVYNACGCVPLSEVSFGAERKHAEESKEIDRLKCVYTEGIEKPKPPVGYKKKEGSNVKS